MDKYDDKYECTCRAEPVISTPVLIIGLSFFRIFKGYKAATSGFITSFCIHMCYQFNNLFLMGYIINNNRHLNIV